MKGEYRLTREGVEELEKELKDLNAQKPEIAEKIRLAREHGDLTENAEYQISKDELSRVEGRIAQIEHILQNAEIVTGARKTTAVKIGSKVELKNGNGKKEEYSIVGSMEADPLENKISDESPIGKALLGKKVGEKVEVTTPGGKLEYSVLNIV